jgi:hypothetical protein
MRARRRTPLTLLDRTRGSTDTRAPGDFRIAQGKQSSRSLEPTRLDVVQSATLVCGWSYARNPGEAGASGFWVGAGGACSVTALRVGDRTRRAPDRGGARGGRRVTPAQVLAYAGVRAGKSSARSTTSLGASSTMKWPTPGTSSIVMSSANGSKPARKTGRRMRSPSPCSILVGTHRRRAVLLRVALSDRAILH